MTPRARGRARTPTRTTPDQIVAAALMLTRSEGLDGWTIRGLAAAVGVTPNVIYDRKLDRAAIVTAVADRVAHLIAEAVPERGPSWRGWLRQYAGALRSVLVDYPGVARELAVWATSATGPAHPVIRALTPVLRDADMAEPDSAARLFLTLACSAVSLEHDRCQRGGQAWVVHSEGMVQYGQMIDTLLAGLAAGQTTSRQCSG